MMGGPSGFSSRRLTWASFDVSSGLRSWDLARGDLLEDALVEVGESVLDSGLYTISFSTDPSRDM